jgi:hypothetical protein
MRRKMTHSRKSDWMLLFAKGACAYLLTHKNRMVTLIGVH